MPPLGNWFRSTGCRRKIRRYFKASEFQVVFDGQAVYVQAQQDNYVHYLIDGTKEIHLADLGAGEAFGEGALIADKPRNASVTMLSDGTLMCLSRDDFNELIRHPLLHGVSARTAMSQIDGGFEWLDIRHPEECASTLLRRSHNLPFNILRLRANRLDKTIKPQQSEPNTSLR